MQRLQVVDEAERQRTRQMWTARNVSGVRLVLCECGKENRMNDLDIIIFAISGVAIILISLYVVISITQDINETMRKCNKIGTWAKKELERRSDGTD